MKKINIIDLVLDLSAIIRNAINVVDRLHWTIEEQQQIIVDLNHNINVLEKRIINIENKLDIKI